MSEERITDITVDTTQAEKELEQLRLHSAMTERTVLDTTRKSYEILALSAELFGMAIPIWFSLMAEMAMLAGTMFQELAKAETVSGWLAAKAFVTFAISGMLFYRAMLILQRKSEAEAKLETVLMIIERVSSF